MIENINLEYSYSLEAPVGGGESTLTMKTNYTEDVTAKNFYINDEIEKGPIEFFSIYSTGLVVFFRQSVDLIEIFSNKEFNLTDDGTFILVG